jgi:hypothetical protein
MHPGYIDENVIPGFYMCTLIEIRICDINLCICKHLFMCIYV